MKFKNIDLLRGIAALAVTVFHLSNNSGLNGSSSHFGKFGYLGVEIFFVISGYILPYSMARRNYQFHDLLRFNAKRMVRLYPPFLTAMLLTLLLMIVTRRPIPPVQILASQTLYLNGILGYYWTSPVFWTLAIEVQFYVFISLCYPLLARGTALQQVFLSISLLIAGQFISSSFLPHWLGMFGMGVLMFKKSEQQVSVNVYWLLTVLLAAFITYENGLFEAITCVATILFMNFVPISESSLLNRFGLWLGSISYSLYLTHWDFGRTGVALFRHVAFLGNYESLRLLFGIASSFGVAWAFYLAIELPAVKLSKKITYYNKSKE